MSLNSISLPDGTRYVLEEQTPPVPPSSVPLWRMKYPSNPRDAATSAAQQQDQPSHGFPDIIPLAEGVQRVQLTQAWQLYIAAINPRMDKRRVSGLLGDAVAFTNKTGFGGSVPRRNYLIDEDLKANALPEFDKVRTCGGACHTGVIEGDMLRLLTLDGNLPPPNIAEVNPLSHPYLFFHATIVWMSSDGEELARKPFVNKSAPAPEWGYDFDVTLMPLVACVPIYRRMSDVEAVNEYTLPYLSYP